MEVVDGIRIFHGRMIILDEWDDTLSHLDATVISW